MPTGVKLAGARPGARADDDPLWASSDPSARRWDPPLSEIGREQVNIGGRSLIFFLFFFLLLPLSRLSHPQRKKKKKTGVVPRGLCRIPRGHQARRLALHEVPADRRGGGAKDFGKGG